MKLCLENIINFNYSAKKDLFNVILKELYNLMLNCLQIILQQFGLNMWVAMVFPCVFSNALR